MPLLLARSSDPPSESRAPLPSPPLDPLLLDLILDRLKNGKENLDIIVWALDWGIPCDRVLNILEALDINSRRLAHQLDR